MGLHQRGDYPFAGKSVAIGVAGLRHGVVTGFVFQQEGHFFHNEVSVGADQLHCAGGDGLGTFSGVAHHQHGLAQAGGFFLDAATVGEHQRALLHEIDKGEVLQRFNEEDVGILFGIPGDGRFAEDLLDGLAHVGVEVHGIDKLYFGIFLRQGFDGVADVKKSFAKVLPAVAGDEYQLVPVGQWRHEIVDDRCGEPALQQVLLDGSLQASFALDLADNPMEGVDHGVAGDGDARRVDALPDQVFPAEGRGREVPAGDAAGDLPVYLFGPGAVDVVGAEPCFDVADGDLLVEGGQGGSHGGGGVAVDQYHVGMRLPVHVAQAGEHTGGDVVQVLPLLHDVEVVMGLYPEEVQYLVEHLTVLSGHADEGLEMVALPLKGFDQRGHFDGFGAGAKDEEDCFHISLNTPQKSRMILSSLRGRVLNGLWATRKATMSASS